MTRILGLAGGPEAEGQISTAVEAVLAGVADGGAETEVLELSRAGLPNVFEAVEAVVFGGPSTERPTARCSRAS